MNVGPTARGYFDRRAMSRLEAFAKWMDRNSRSIYGCTMAPDEFPEANGVRYTWNPKTKRLYVHILDWPFQRLHLPNLAGKVAYAQFLHDGSELQWFENGQASWNSEDLPAGTLTLKLPVVQPDVIVPTVELFLK